MKNTKKAIIFLVLLSILPSVLALNLEIEKTSSNGVLVLGIDQPVVFELKITNLGADDNIEFYNLIGFSMFPRGTTSIASGETKKIQLGVSPIGKFEHKGAYTFKYFIKSQDNSEIIEKLTFNSIEMKDAFEIGSGEFNPESSSIDVYIKNKVNFNFPELNAKFSSVFFTIEENFSLAPYEKKDFTIQLNKEDFKQLMAGFYTLNAEVNVEDEKASIEGVVRFVEKDIVTSTKNEYGFIISKKIIEKKNEGNTISKSETQIEKNIISRLFTSFTPEPEIVERHGLAITYTWNREIKPGETLEITVKTNWLLPFLVILFVVVIVVLAKQYAKTNLSLRKKVSFVKAKGGEFALRVSITIHARKYIEKVSVIDRLPSLVKIYERFGSEEPSRIDEKNKRIEWNFEKLEPGEMRKLSYIIYSKVGILGKFALPSATAIYEKDSRIYEEESNKAFFVAEQRKKDLEEE